MDTLTRVVVRGRNPTFMNAHSDCLYNFDFIAHILTLIALYPLLCTLYAIWIAFGCDGLFSSLKWLILASTACMCGHCGGD